MVVLVSTEIHAAMHPAQESSWRSTVFLTNLYSECRLMAFIKAKMYWITGRWSIAPPHEHWTDSVCCHVDNDANRWWNAPLWQMVQFTLPFKRNKLFGGVCSSCQCLYLQVTANQFERNLHALIGQSLPSINTSLNSEQQCSHGVWTLTTVLGRYPFRESSRPWKHHSVTHHHCAAVIVFPCWQWWR